MQVPRSIDIRYLNPKEVSKVIHLIMSSKLFFIALCLASAQALTLKFKNKALDISYCLDGSDQWVSNIMLDVQPWPVTVATGATFTLDGGLDILQEIEPESMLRLELTLKTAIGDLPIPCIPVSIGNLTLNSMNGR